jgi:predicted DNA-binding protein
MTDPTNSVIAFRLPSSMKERMKAVAEANGQCVSSFIRSACAEAMRKSSQKNAEKPSELRDDQ